GFEHPRERAVLARPRNIAGLHATLPTVRARNPRPQLRLELHRVQMPPGALRREVSPRRGLSAARARQTSAPETHPDTDLLVLHVQRYLLDLPVVVQTQQQRVM